MIGYVYLIQFPSGLSYIGSTTNVDSRLIQHWRDKTGACYSTAREYCTSPDDLRLLTGIVYEGPLYKIVEIDEINKREKSTLLNRDIVAIDSIRRIALEQNITLMDVANLLNIEYSEMNKIRSYTEDRLQLCAEQYKNLMDRAQILLKERK